MAGLQNEEGNNNVCIGYEAGYNEIGSNRLHIANTRNSTLIYGQFDQNRVGIATTRPGNTLDVAGGIDINDYIRHNMDENTYLGFPSLDEIRMITAGNSRLSIKPNGNVGIGTDLPQEKLHVNGNIRVNRLVNNSDIKYKKNISYLSSEVQKLTKVKGVRYQMDVEKYPDNGFRDQEMFGFLAQDLREVYPNLVVEDEFGHLSIDYIGLIPVLVENSKRKTKEIEEIKEALNDLKINYENLLKKIVHLSDHKSKKQTKEKVEIQNKREAILYANKPNPFTEVTKISFYLPAECSSATLHIFDINGRPLRQKVIEDRGKVEVKIYGNELSAGIYLYTLVVDDKEVDTKRMILTR